MKIKLGQTFETKGERKQRQATKLIISKFEGTNLDRLRFWSQFETKRDHADIITISIFSYLKELVIPKVRALRSCSSIHHRRM